MSLRGIEDQPDTVSAETCEACRGCAAAHDMKRDVVLRTLFPWEAGQNLGGLQSGRKCTCSESTDRDTLSPATTFT